MCWMWKNVCIFTANGFDWPSVAVGSSAVAFTEQRVDCITPAASVNRWQAAHMSYISSALTQPAVWYSSAQPASTASSRKPCAVAAVSAPHSEWLSRASACQIQLWCAVRQSCMSQFLHLIMSYSTALCQNKKYCSNEKRTRQKSTAIRQSVFLRCDEFHWNTSMHSGDIKVKNWLTDRRAYPCPHSLTAICLPTQ